MNALVDSGDLYGRGLSPRGGAEKVGRGPREEAVGIHALRRHQPETGGKRTGGRCSQAKILFGAEIGHVRFGSKADMCSAKGHVRSTPESGHVQCTGSCPLCANSGLMHCSRMYLYSITSSAWASNVDEIVRPSAFAVFLLIATSNFVGCSTGRSAGFAPLRILST